jgi:hypothetical protein
MIDHELPHDGTLVQIVAKAVVALDYQGLLHRYTLT